MRVLWRQGRRSLQPVIVAVALRSVQGAKNGAYSPGACTMPLLQRNRQLQDLRLHGMPGPRSRGPMGGTNRGLPAVCRPGIRGLQRIALPGMQRARPCNCFTKARRSGPVNAKTNRDLISSLRGANFRRVTLDGQTRLLRAIRTLCSLRTLGCRPSLTLPARTSAGHRKQRLGRGRNHES